MIFFAVFFGTIFTVGIAIIIFTLSVKRGYIDLNKYVNLKKYEHVIPAVISIVNNIATYTKPTTSTSCVIGDTKRFANITYTKYGHSKQINVPYRREHMHRMTHWKLSLITGKQQINITQEPGYPYLCSANDLGGERIVAYNTTSDKSVIFTGDIVPNYLESTESHGF